ncbi:hypothetical protein LIA77_04692 [Sarocladium implicatum]|nr:hypothetical protein LIA77_04692 [Sarocladium implicatum]
MISSSARNAPPAPIDIQSPSLAHPRKARRSESDDPLPPKRSDTLTSEDSIVESPASLPKTPSSSSWRRDSPAINVHTHCGRHGDQFLFSGPSLRELARVMLRRSS